MLQQQRNSLAFSDEGISPLRWVARLSNGEEVFQNDGAGSPSSAWLRLKTYCEENGLSIEKIILEFRSHKEEIPKAEKGYFFRKAAVAAWGCDTYEHYIFGLVNENTYKALWYMVPELILIKEEHRDLEKDKDSIIWNA